VSFTEIVVIDIAQLSLREGLKIGPGEALLYEPVQAGSYL
jgi:hypothetical protein